MATLTVKNLTTASGQDLALRTGGTDRLTISSSDGSVTIGGGLALGPSPASSGYLRIPNNQSITARNAANTGNVNLIGLNSSDQIVFGTGLSLGDQSITNVYSISQTNSNNWNISNAGAATFAGTLNLTGAGAQLYVGNTNTSTQSCLIQIGNGRTGSGQSYIDFVGDTTYTDFGMRLARDGGANGSSYIQHRGTGDLALLGQDASAISLRTNNTERLKIESDGLITVTKAGAILHVGNANTSTESCAIQIGHGRTSAGQSYIDLVADTTYSDYGMRLSRESGTNGVSFIKHRGTGDLALLSEDASAISLRTNNTERLRVTSTGSVGIGTASPAVSLQTSDDTDTSDRRI